MPGFGVWAIAVQVPVMILVMGHLSGHATSLTLPPDGTKVTQPTTTTTFLLRQLQPPPHFYLAAREGFAASAAG
uniref:Putative secreted mucin n=1 Tax=Amblyomma triste TaxID=251400 RepID=A0A023G399_AMBTT